MSNIFLNYGYSKKINEIEQEVNEIDMPKDLSPRAMDLRVKSCLKLALKIAKDYYGQSRTGFDLDDLVQVANEGLCMAAQRYTNPDAKFATYAYFWIKKYVLEFINVGSRPLAVSNHEGFCRVTDELSFVSKDSFVQGNNDDYDNSINNLLVSDFVNGDVLADQELNCNHVQTELNELLSCLETLERQVLCASFGLAPFDKPLNIKEQAKYFNNRIVTLEKVYAKAVSKVKEFAIENDYDIEQLILSAKTITKDTKRNDYVEKHKRQEINDEAIELIATMSNVSPIVIENILYYHGAPQFEFVSERKVLGYTIKNTFRISRRLMNSKIRCKEYIKIYNKEGELVKEYLKKEHATFWMTSITLPMWLVNDMKVTHIQKIV